MEEATTRLTTTLHVFDWNWLWVARDHGPTGHRGTVLEPKDWNGAPAGLSLEQLEETACLILLGESGSGKTYAMRSEQRRIASQGGEVLAVDLRAYGSEDRLHRDVFAGA